MHVSTIQNGITFVKLLLIKISVKQLIHFWNHPQGYVSCWVRIFGEERKDYATLLDLNDEIFSAILMNGVDPKMNCTRLSFYKKKWNMNSFTIRHPWNSSSI